MVTKVNGNSTSTFGGDVDLGANNLTQNNLTGFTAKAWVNFNGTGTVAIRASGNVSSITDNGTGDYTVNFTTAMPDANYSSSLDTTTYTTNNNVIKAQILGTTAGGPTLQSTTQLRFDVGSVSGTSTNYDMAQICVNIFR